MAEELTVPVSGNKEAKYLSLLLQIEGLVAGETDLVANLANIAAALKQVFDFFWVGFYLCKKKDLVLGPFQGPVACTRISWGKGVCGSAWKNKEIIIVPNVEEFPGHIACSSLSKSEIVVPLIVEGEVVLVLDVDSDQLNDFDQIDRFYLNMVVGLLTKHFNSEKAS